MDGWRELELWLIKEGTRKATPEPLNSINWHLRLVRLDEYEMFATLLLLELVRCS